MARNTAKSSHSHLNKHLRIDFSITWIECLIPSKVPLLCSSQIVHITHNWTTFHILLPPWRMEVPLLTRKHLGHWPCHNPRDSKYCKHKRLDIPRHWMKEEIINWFYIVLAHATSIKDQDVSFLEVIHR